MNTTQAMNKGARLGLAAFAAASIALGGGKTLGADTSLNLPAKCKDPDRKCDCPGNEGVKNGCIKVNVDLGETTPWTGSLECSLKIFADNDSPSIFTVDSLYAILGGYTFKRLGTENLADGATPAEVVLSRRNGEPVHFVFREGESMAQPDPGVHIKMDERLMMVDAEGWAATHDPVYYDLYVGDGTRRRILATDMTGALGALVSITDARGVTATPADMGIDIVYDSNGVRQFLTPARLADIVQHPGFTGYDVKVYAIAEAPSKDATTGLYALPNAAPMTVVTIRRENDGKRAVVTMQKGGADQRRYVFDYAMDDWSLRHPSGVEERKERYIDDERAAQVLEEAISSAGVRLSRTECNYKWESWGFALTNKVEGFDGVTDTTEWTYYTSGNGKGQVKTEKRQTGLLIQYAYDNLDRVISETRSGHGMMTEVTTYDYTPVDPSDPLLPVDTRPRTVVRALDGIECERTYYVYSPLTNIVERVGTQGAPYGSTNALRTITTFYPVESETGIGNGESGIGNGEPVGGDHRAPRSGFVQSIRHEDGKLDLYDYSLSSNCWTRTVTHLHEQSPTPVSGKTTRDITITNSRGEILEQKTEAYIGEVWYTIARNRMTYNSQGKRIRSENLAGQVTTTAWDCCHKVSETGPDGSTTTWDYDIEGRMIATSRLIPLDMTNVTWLTTCYEYDALGRQTATWQTNYAAQVGLPVTRTRYDQLGRTISRLDSLGNSTQTSYSIDGRTVSVQHPNTSTTLYTRSASGDTLSITGTAVTPEFHFYSVTNIDVATASSPSQISCRVHETRYGSASSPRFTRTYENLLGQTILEERSGFQGAVLATTHAYDSLGRLVSTAADYEPVVEYTYDLFGTRVATTKTVGRGGLTAPPSPDTQWRKSESLSHIAIIDGALWLVQTNIVSCSDSSTAPLVASSSRQLTGLTPALPARSRSTDTRGNVTENQLNVSVPVVTSSQVVPYATNRPLTDSRYGVEIQSVSVSAVTNTVAYDSLGRQISNTDGRGNTRQTEYNSFGQRVASIDALGNRTTYSYDQFGNLASVTDPLGHATVYEYDLRGHKTYEGGATYPVRYTYDIFGNKTTMTTYRNETSRTGGSPVQGDVTTWLYDIASGSMTNKVYADGKGPSYNYTPDGKLAQRTWARGISTDYSYDAWGSLTNTVYSDNTPTVSLAYDALGRQTEAHDAAGVTTFLYDSFGTLTNETVIGVAGTNTIIRHWDSFGRSLGYSLVGRDDPIAPNRQTTLAYNPATGRLASMQIPSEQSNNPNNQTIKQFSWNYLPGSDLKSSLSYPNGLTASWTYDANNQLLQVCNATPTNIISQYDYTYDAAGRRVLCAKSGSAFAQNDTLTYAYNNRSELTNAVAAVDSDYRYAYDFDDIGNRETSSERGTNSVYTANQLNQYTAVDDFTPQFDDDGNQTLIKTATGIWSVTYNGENRPIHWQCQQSNNQTITNNHTILMSFDRMGRRVTKNAQRFVYDGYLQIANFELSTSNFELQTFIWDPTEPIATRPLVWNCGASPAYYVHDGNKNVSEVADTCGAIVAHYEYAPFGVVVVWRGEGTMDSPWRFSSEYTEDEMSAVCYNYRHYVPTMGRWIGVDPLDGDAGTFYSFCNNSPVDDFDMLGLQSITGYVDLNAYATFQELGESFYDDEFYELLPNCPCCIDVSRSLPVLEPKDAVDKGWGRVGKANREHPGATWEVRWVDPEGKLEQGQQCTYDGKGRLITEPPGAGTPDKVSYDGNKHSWRNSHYWGHGLWDWLTYKILSYDMYFKHWPPNNGNNCPKNSGQ